MVDELEGVFKLNDVDVAVITEIWMSTAVPDECNHINGYCTFRKRRPLALGRGGGIALYVKNKIPTQHLDIEIPHELECIWMKIRPHRLPVKYRASL